MPISWKASFFFFLSPFRNILHFKRFTALHYATLNLPIHTRRYDMGMWKYVSLRFPRSEIILVKWQHEGETGIRTPQRTIVSTTAYEARSEVRLVCQFVPGWWFKYDLNFAVIYTSTFSNPPWSMSKGCYKVMKAFFVLKQAVWPWYWLFILMIKLYHLS